jgi:hypothetical protein
MRKMILSMVVLLLVPINFLCAQEKHIKITYDSDKNPKTLETAITTYKNSDGKTIDLVAVVHVGDKSYYKKQNKKFQQYDKVCFELVAEKGVKPTNQASMPWKFVKGFLDLDHQLEHINYESKNFVHADLSPSEMKEILKSRGESELTIAMKTIMEMMTQQQKKQEEINLEQALSDSKYLKRKLASQLASGEASLGSALDQLLVKDRNKKAIDVTMDQLKTCNTVALYYGAAHMPDFERRLRALGFKKTGSEWLVAWDISSDD